MQLNFTGLDKIASAENGQRNATQGATFTAVEYQTTTEREKPAEGQETAKNGNYQLQREADTRRDAIQTAADVYKRYQQATIDTAGLRSEILRGIRAGTDIYSLFLKAAKIVALTTDNSLFYEQIERELPAVYGIGLNIKDPLRIELQAAEERLKRLQDAEREERQPDIRETIQAAIREHQRLIQDLKAKL